MGRAPVLQLNPPLRLYTPHGAGHAHFLRIEGDEADMMWTVFLHDGRIVEYPNHMVRAQENFSQERTNIDKPARLDMTATGPTFDKGHVIGV